MPRPIVDCLTNWIESPRSSNFSSCQDALLELADTLFFASLATEEKTPTRVSLVWALNGVDLNEVLDSESPILEPAWIVVALEARPFDVQTVVKAAPLVEYGRSALVVAGSPQSFFIKGVARRDGHNDGGEVVVLSAPSPGVISISCRDEEIFRYERGAEEVNRPPLILWIDGPVRKALDGVGESLQLKTNVINRAPFQEVTQSLISGMSRTQHGGLILFIPTAPTEKDLAAVKLKLLDRTVLARAIKRTQIARIARTSALMSRKTEQEQPSAREIETDIEFRAAERCLEETILDVARMTAVDNALLIGPGFQVIGAQYEVPSEQAPDVHIATDVMGAVGETYKLNMHGSRHRAAACFVHEKPGALAFVASADGPIRCFLSLQGSVVTWPVRLPYV